MTAVVEVAVAVVATVVADVADMVAEETVAVVEAVLADMVDAEAVGVVASMAADSRFESADWSVSPLFHFLSLRNNQTTFLTQTKLAGFRPNQKKTNLVYTVFDLAFSSQFCCSRRNCFSWKHICL